MQSTVINVILLLFNCIVPHVPPYDPLMEDKRAAGLNNAIWKNKCDKTIRISSVQKINIFSKKKSLIKNVQVQHRHCACPPAPPPTPM